MKGATFGLEYNVDNDDDDEDEDEDSNAWWRWQLEANMKSDDSKGDKP